MPYAANIIISLTLHHLCTILHRNPVAYSVVCNRRVPHGANIIMTHSASALHHFISRFGCVLGRVPQDYDSLSTSYGDGGDMKKCIAALHRHGISAVCDVVINHRCAQEQVPSHAAGRFLIPSTVAECVGPSDAAGRTIVPFCGCWVHSAFRPSNSDFVDVFGQGSNT